MRCHDEGDSLRGVNRIHYKWIERFDVHERGVQRLELWSLVYHIDNLRFNSYETVLYAW